jgi:hypothetical protein
MRHSYYRWLAKVLMVGLLCGIAPSSFALNWVFNGQSADGGRFWLDMDSLDFSTPTVRYMVRHDPVASVKKTPNGLNYAYTASQYVADCGMGTSQEVSKNYMEGRGWLVATGNPSQEVMVLSQRPNSIHTVLVNALCFLNKAGLRSVNLSLSQEWTEELAIVPNNDVRSALSRYTVAPQSLQKKGDLLFFVQNLTYQQNQLFGDRAFATRVAIGAFNCRTEERSSLLLSMYYLDQDPQAQGWSGTSNPDTFMAFSRYENTEKFRRYCMRFSESRGMNQAPLSPLPRSNATSKPLPVPPKPIEEEKKKIPPVRSDSLL